MDRQTIYPGQVPLETDLLKTNQNVMVGLAKLSEAIFGTGGIAVGFGTTQTVVPSLAVLVAPGEIYSQENLESSAVSSLPQDLAHSLVKQGILLEATTLPVTAPATPGFSVNYLLQVDYQDVDSGSAVLPYYNASNPSIAYSGPANSGSAQATSRKGAAVLSLKAGTAATTGTQATPAPDAGKMGLYVVTVANGASTVVNANIAPYALSGRLGSPIVQMCGPQNEAVFLNTGNWVVPPNVYRIFCRVWGGGGGGGGTSNGGAAGGAGGGYAEGWFAVTPGASLAVTVGNGGTLGSGVPTAGGAGGASSVGALLTASGGGGGAGASGGAGAPVNSAVGNGSGGQLNIAGNAAAGGFTIGGTPLGSAGGGTYGTSMLGGTSPSTGNGSAFPGGGGGGAGGTTFANGALGAKGLVVIQY